MIELVRVRCTKVDMQSCRRCVQSGRICQGYRDDLLFCHYTALPPIQIPSMIQQWPHEVGDEQLMQHALETCIHDFVVRPAKPSLSRGFLHGLLTLLHEAGPSSDLAGAARILALGAVGNRMGRPILVYNTALQYGELLLSFQASLAQPNIPPLHLLVTGVLLGLYEVRPEPRTSRINIIDGVVRLICVEYAPCCQATFCRLTFQPG